MDTTTITFAVDSTQVNTATAALDKFAATGGKAAASATAFERAAGNQGKALGVIAPAAVKAATGVDALADANKALGASTKAGAGVAASSLSDGAAQAGKAAAAAAELERAQVKLGRASLAAADAQEKLNRLQLTAASIPAAAMQAQRLVVRETAAAVPIAQQRVAVAQQRFDDVVRPPSPKVAQGLNEIGKSAKFAKFQNQQLAFQLNDFAVQVASGGGFLIPLIQQGSQLSGTFGGIGNAARAVLGLLTPVRLAVLGVGSAVGVFALGASRSEQWARSLGDLRTALEVTGRAGAVSGTQFEQMIDGLAKAPGITRDAATQVVTELARAGNVSVSLLTGIAKAVPDFARAVGKDAPEAARLLAQAIGDPVQGAKKLEEVLPRLSSATRLLVRDLINQGDVLGAQRTLLADVARATAGLASNVTPLQKSTNELGNSWDALMKSLRDSGGSAVALGGLNALLGGVQRVIDKAGELARTGIQLPALSVGTGVPIPPFVAAALEVAKRTAGALTPTPDDPSKRRASGSVTDQAGKPVNALAQTAVIDQTTNALNQQTKAALALGEGFASTGKRIDELVVKQRTLQAALTANVKAGKGNSPEAKELRGQIAGVGEQLDGLRKKGAGKKDNEPEQLRRAQLDTDLSALQAAFAKERDQNTFHQRFLASTFQAGNLSLKEYYAERRRVAAAGVAGEIAELDKVRTRLEQERAAVKDPSEKQTLGKRIDGVVADQERLRARSAQDATLANGEEAASFRNLADEVENYRANLKALQGDEAGASRIRAESQLRRSDALADATRGTPNAITAADIAVERKSIETNILLQESRERSSQVLERLAIEEERIALKRQTGALTENAALAAEGEARRKVVGALEEQLAAQEALLQGRPNDNGLILNIERTRLELEKLKATLDPLKDKFDNLFKDAGANALTDLFNGKFAGFNQSKFDADVSGVDRKFNRQVSTIKAGSLTGTARDDALIKANQEREAGEKKARKDATASFWDQAKAAGKVFGQQITQQMNADLAKTLSGKLFGEGGPLGGAGAAAAKVFGGDKPTVDTSAIMQSLSDFKALGVDPGTAAFSATTQSLGNLKSLGIDPGIEALQRFAKAADNAQSGFGKSSEQDGQSDPGQQSPASPFSLDGTFRAPAANEGSFSLGNGGLTGEQSTLDLFKAPQTAGVSFSTSLVEARRKTTDFSDILGPAAQALSGMGQAGQIASLALRLLPGVIQAMTASSSASSGGGGLGDIFKMFGTLFGGGSSTGGFGFGTGAGFGNQDLGLFLHSGGIVGKDKDVRPVPAGVFGGAKPNSGSGKPNSALKLAANEVPAILMGGPKGQREEVLRGDDPRHRDNMPPALLKIMQSATRYHTGGIAGQKPDLLQPGRPYVMQTAQGGDANRPSTQGGSKSIVVNVNQSFNGPQSKQTMSQGAAQAARAVRGEVARGTA